MKKVSFILLMLISMFLFTSCRMFNVYRITYEADDFLHSDYSNPRFGVAGDEITIYCDTIFDANLSININGLSIKENNDLVKKRLNKVNDYSVTTFKFIMPNTDVYITFDVTDGFFWCEPVVIENFSARCIDTGYNEIISPFTIIESKTKLDEYYLNNKDNYNLERNDSEYKPGFLNACDKYDENWFNDNVLILIPLIENSGSNSHKVSHIEVDHHGNMNIYITRIIPEIGTCDMAGCHVFLELNKRDFYIAINVDIHLDTSYE
mgnify:CR=1 FL=1